jgi:hypothetical protein
MERWTGGRDPCNCRQATSRAGYGSSLEHGQS